MLEARSALADFTGDVLILYGDTPLLRSETLRDMREHPIPREIRFYFEGGIRSFVRYMNRNRRALHDPICHGGFPYCYNVIKVNQ